MGAPGSNGRWSQILLNGSRTRWFPHQYHRTDAGLAADSGLMGSTCMHCGRLALPPRSEAEKIAN
jgi:hypothetical protein